MNWLPIQRKRPRGRRDLTVASMIEALEPRQLLADGIQPAGAPQINGSPGTALNNVLVATFTITDANLAGPGSGWKAQINWGDGTAPDKQVSVTAGAGGVWEFFDSHTYTAAGTYTISVDMGVPGRHIGHDGNNVTTTAVIASAATLQSIAVTPANPSIAKGLTKQFTATGTYSDNTTKNITSQVTWASGTPTVASITTGGLATGLAVGSSTISASLGGVTGSTVLTVTAAALQSIAVTPANPSVAKGLTKQFTATGTFTDNTTQNLTSQVTWASGTTSVATINASGLATAVSPGTSTISATLSGVSGSTTMTVTAAALQSIAVTPANPSITKGATQQFTATGTYSDSSTQNLTSQVTWASGTPTVATITAAGLATGVAAGTSNISATLGGVTGSTTLTVSAATLQSIAVTPANPSVAKGLKQQFTATGTFSDNTTQNITSQVTWASGTTTVATINASGLASTVGTGTSTISASLGSVTGSTVLTVTAAALQSIAVTPANPSVAKGSTKQFTATGTYTDSTTQNLTSQVTWSSGTPTVATIDTAGLATAVGTGTSTISATLGGVTGSTVLTVTAAALQSIAVTPANPSIAKGLKQQFTATGTFSDNTTQNITSQVTWASGTPTVATITAAGLATGVAAGTSTISATLGGVTGSTVLTVTAAALQSIAVTPANPSVAKGLTQQFTATGTYSDSTTQNITSQVTWASGTTTVATINASGLASTVGTGTSTISATLGSVTGSTVLTVTAAALQSIAVTPANPTIVKGTTQQFTATGTYTDSSTQNLTSQVTWSSGTTTVATVSASGLATAVAPGNSTISAKLGTITGSTVLNVTAAALVSIAVTPANPSIAKGLKQQFTATGTFSDNSTQNITNQVTWASATPAVATINATGQATAVGVGTSDIKATLGTISGSTTLTVTAAQLVSIAVTPANPSVAKGLTKQFTATGTYTDSTTQNLTSSVTWASGTPTVATIDNTGLATTLAVGSSTISATQSGVTGSTTLTVTAPALVSVAVTPANPSIAKGLTQQFTATGTYTDNSTQNLTSQATWASATPAVATISAAGLATGMGVGTSSISAKVGTITGSTVLTVTAAQLKSIAVTPANPSVAKGLTKQFTATGTYTDNTTQNLTSQVTWASGTTSVATITPAGLATAVATGTSSISATLGGTTGSTTLTVAPAALVSISVTPANASVAKGLTQQFTATGNFTDSSTQDLTSQVTWSSANPTIATINTSGLATGVNQGSTTISAKLGTITGSTPLNVTTGQLVSIAITPINPTIIAGFHDQFTATGTYSDNSKLNITSQVTWSSGTPSVATIDAGGLATGVAPGITSISAHLGTVTGSTNLTVSNVSLVSIAVTPASPSVAKGSTEQFTATGTFSDNSTLDLTGLVTWASATPSVATIDTHGLATSLAEGTSSISATFHGVNGSTLLTVNPAALASIAISPANPSIVKGLKQQFQATGEFTDHTTQDLTSQVTWASANTGVATIDGTGLATGAGVGKSTISATMNGVSGSTVLNVTAAQLVSIAVSPANPSVARGLKQQFSATGSYTDGTSQNITNQVTWASANPAIATISGTGLATATGVGSAAIHATLGGVTGTATINVTPAQLVSLAVSPANPAIDKGATQQFQAVGGFTDGSTQILTSQVSWSSSNAGIATITNQGLATGVAQGSTTITAAMNGLTSTATLKVNTPPPPPQGTPLDRARAAFVATLYVDILGRVGQPAEIAFWTGLLARGVSFNTVALDIWRSPEHQLLLNQHRAPQMSFVTAVIAAFQNAVQAETAGSSHPVGPQGVFQTAKGR